MPLWQGQGEPADFRCSLLGPSFHSSSLASMKRISSFKACLLACMPPGGGEVVKRTNSGRGERLALSD